MKHILIAILLIVIASAISEHKENLTLSDSSQTIYADQYIQLCNSSFSPLYLHVFEYDKEGPVKHYNLTEDLKGEIMRIESFKLFKGEGSSVWLATLKNENDDKIYLCEIEDALKTNEIIIL